MIATLRADDKASKRGGYRVASHDDFGSDAPLGFAAGDANLTRYVGNSPPNLADPSGLAPVDEAISIPRGGLTKPAPVLSGQVTGPNGQVVGTYDVTVLHDLGTGALIGTQFNFNPSGTGQYGWIQHTQVGAGQPWLYDNREGKGAPSNPALPVQPVQREWDARPALNSQLQCWQNNPWYGGPSAPGALPRPTHSWPTVIPAFMGPQGILPAAVTAQITQLGLKPDAAFWQNGVVSYWKQNPFPQASFFDAPEAGNYIAQLVVAGDSLGNGPGAGTVVLAIAWTPPSTKPGGDDSAHFKPIPPGTK